MSSLSDPSALRQRVAATVDCVPRGKVATYGQIAREAGLGRRARFVGRVLRELPEGSRLPWHRVVNASGGISVAGASAREQRRRLAREGVRFASSGRVDLERYRWRGFAASVPETPTRRTRSDARTPRR